MEYFEVALTDEQLEAARGSAAARGVGLGPEGSLQRDSVTLNYTVRKDEAGTNTVAVTVLYRPFYIHAETIQGAITDFLLGTSTGQEGQAGNPYAAFTVNESGTLPDGAAFVLIDASKAQVDVTLGARPIPNVPVYLVVTGSGHKVTVNGIALGNSTNGDEAIGLISDGAQWFVFTKYGW